MQQENKARDCDCGYSEGKMHWHSPECTIFPQQENKEECTEECNYNREKELNFSKCDCHCHNTPPQLPTPEERAGGLRSCKELSGHNNFATPDFDALKDFIRTQLDLAKSAGREEERQFILNILDGIDQADEQMGNKGGGTKAIRHALKSRII